MESLGIPFSAIPGNHDQSALLAEGLGLANRLKNGELYYDQSWGSWLVLFLDSARGFLSPGQKHWLSQQLYSHGSHPVLVFIHHPPCLAGVPYMDSRYALQDRDEVLAILGDHAASVELFCGHYHVEKSLRIGRVGIHITPSTFFQIDMHQEAFSIDHYRIGFRQIWLQGERLLSTMWWG
jgi:Icc protein